MLSLNTQQKQALNGYKFIDLFCGIGGFHLALAAFGSECVFASEINNEAKKIYTENFHIEPKGDITKINADDIPAHDIICAGFPCQPFSVSGNQVGLDAPSGKLFFEITKIARHHHPKVILLENVANLENHNKGKTIDTMLDDLRDAGYTPFKKNLDSSNFGVPQCRKRLYIVAFKNDLNIHEFIFPNGTLTQTKLVDILQGEDETEAMQCRIHRKFNLRGNHLDSEPQYGTIVRIGEIGTGRQGERIYSIHGCATTLSSTGGGLGGRTGIYYINRHIRKLTARECARLMGFPDEYIISSLRNQAYCQFGNSVVVNVLQQIIIEVLPHFREEKKNNG
ncbi:cytosine-specific methyltransferase [Spirochaetia bacterium]|nr:cytosine-specific methyltransferase [Spirochaetia bacterium]